MYRVILPVWDTASAWRRIARNLTSHRIPPADVIWSIGPHGASASDLFGGQPVPAQAGPVEVRAPASFVTEAATALCHGDPSIPGLLHVALHRHQSAPGLWSNPADPLTRRIGATVKTVRRDIHKMHAFVRFREMPSVTARRRFGAWFEPDHRILEAATPFFAKRFADMDWLIATPFGTALHEDGVLGFGDAMERPTLPDDASEELWGTYFTNIFNPARIKLAAMRSEMPQKYWKNLPETRLIPDMLADADARVARMQAALPDHPPVFAERIRARQQTSTLALETPVTELPATLADAAIAAKSCTRCHLCQSATQTVWGEGDPAAPLMIVGEQPGDREDLGGRPFIGPAGTLLRGILEEASPGPVWLTNAVKHFKFKPQGKIRLHQNPNRSEIDHCRWWLGLERSFIQPKLTVALGLSAAFALTGNAASLSGRRGRIETAQDGGPVLISWHPSYLLRAPESRKVLLRKDLADDLRLAGEIIRHDRSARAVV